MRLLSFKVTGTMGYGIAGSEGVVDLTPHLGKIYPTLGDLIAVGLHDAQAAAQGHSPDYSFDDIEFLPPILRPEKIICVGLNYRNPDQPPRSDREGPKYPSIFMRVPGSLVGHKAFIMRPPESIQLDYEGEIAIVIGRPGRRIPEESAADHIAGLTCINEGTVRDWMFHGKFNVTQGKNFDRSGSIGPWIVTADEFNGFDRLRISTRVNGESRQEDTTASLVFPFTYLIHYISTFTTLRPGDIIATGTPQGTGGSFDPPKCLKPGDLVEVEVSGIGILSNAVVDESL